MQSELIKNTTGDWTFTAAVEGLDLSQTPGNEFRIDRVTFMTSERLARTRKRNGYKFRISHYYRRYSNTLRRYLGKSSAIAVCRFKGKGSAIEDECKAIIKSELAILSLAQLGWSRRRIHGNPRLRNAGRPTSIGYWYTEHNSQRGTLHSEVSEPITKLQLDKDWKDYQADTFYFPLLRILRGEERITKNWQNDIIRAARLMGESQATGDLGTAFLWNMIAIETLLTDSDDKYSVELPKRVFAFIGWVDVWETEKLPEKLDAAYKLRCGLVHAGKFNEVTVEDVLFTDGLALNVIENVVSQIRIFKSKKDLIDFSDKVQAEKLLGIKSKVRPKTLSYTKLHYSDRDRNEI